MILTPTNSEPNPTKQINGGREKKIKTFLAFATIVVAGIMVQIQWREEDTMEKNMPTHRDELSVGIIAGSAKEPFNQPLAMWPYAASVK